MALTPLISVVIPVYNAEKFIEKCAKSLFEQTFDQIEYIFVDDCSTDNSVEILQSLIDKYQRHTYNITIITQRTNQGVAIARNTGLSQAKGEYVIFCDSDDWLDTQMLQKMYSTAITSNADVVMCDFYMAFNTGYKQFRCPTWCNENKVASMQQYLTFSWNVIWNMLIKRDLCIKNNINFSPRSTYCEDFNFAVKVLDRAAIVKNIHEPLYYYNQLNTNSIMHHLNEKAMYSEQKMCLDIIYWFNKENTLSHYIKEMSWRVLKSKQELILKTKTYGEFLALFPQSHNYIWSCPWLNFKLKLMMWCLVHHLKPVSILMLKLRNIKALVYK